MDARLDEVVLRALEKDPERRYQRVADLAADLLPLAGSNPQLAPVRPLQPITRPYTATAEATHTAPAPPRGRFALRALPRLQSVAAFTGKRLLPSSTAWAILCCLLGVVFTIPPWLEVPIKAEAPVVPEAVALPLVPNLTYEWTGLAFIPGVYTWNGLATALLFVILAAALLFLGRTAWRALALILTGAIILLSAWLLPLARPHPNEFALFFPGPFTSVQGHARMKGGPNIFNPLLDQRMHAERPKNVAWIFEAAEITPFPFLALACACGLVILGGCQLRSARKERI
jgi:hypothetical protein